MWLNLQPEKPRCPFGELRPCKIDAFDHSDNLHTIDRIDRCEETERFENFSLETV